MKHGPVTVATFGDQLCHLEPKYWGSSQRKARFPYISDMYVEFSLGLEACNEFSFELTIIVIQYKRYLLVQT